MAIYHLYYLRSGMLLGGDEIEAADDHEAERAATVRGEGRTVEVWNEHSRVTVVSPVAAG